MVQSRSNSGDSANALQNHLLHFPELLTATHLVVAYSGGLDSTVLLHLTAVLARSGKLQGIPSAIHVHHGLHKDADDWLQHCEKHAALMQVPLQTRKVRIAQQGEGTSPEAAARAARYAVFGELLPPSGVLLQAHHQDDQMETVLLHLLRGSSPRGLAGIPVRRLLGAGSLLRPLLTFPRSRLLEYALTHGLQWVEDSSNQELRYDRNFLRHAVLPLLQTRWPGLKESVGRTAQLCGEASVLLDAVAEQDLQQVQGKQPNQLVLSRLLQFTPDRIRNLLKFWVGKQLHLLGGSDISFQALMQAVSELLPVAQDATPVISWGKGEQALELRRFQDALYLLKPLNPELPELLLWNTTTVLHLPAALGVLEFLPAQNTATTNIQVPVMEVRFRRGGETIKLEKRPNKTLKNLLQESAVPPWLRDCIPLVFHDGKLLAVADLYYSESWPHVTGQNGARLLWQRSELRCGY